MQLWKEGLGKVQKEFQVECVGSCVFQSQEESLRLNVCLLSAYVVKEGGFLITAAAARRTPAAASSSSLAVLAKHSG